MLRTGSISTPEGIGSISTPEGIGSIASSSAYCVSYLPLL